MGLSTHPSSAPHLISPREPAPLVPLRQPDRHYPIRRRTGYPMAPSQRARPMSNPLRILSTLDQNLTLPAEITLFGRSALALGYPNPPADVQSTQDVDGILPLSWMQPPDSHEDFWRAIELTNSALEPDGLYLTHLSARPMSFCAQSGSIIASLSRQPSKNSPFTDRQPLISSLQKWPVLMMTIFWIFDSCSIRRRSHVTNYASRLTPPVCRTSPRLRKSSRAHVLR